MSTATLLHGHVLDVLRTLPAESVHCVVTSPPYWGLRAYGTPPQVWGGDRSCEHAWGVELPGKRSRWGDLDTLSDKQKSNRGSASMVEALEAPGGAFCRRCGAWRGELGLEPTLGLFVAHLVEVFREVRRVLRRDGTCWVNMGDCYAGTPNGKSAAEYKSEGVDDRTFRDKPFATTGNGLKPKDLCLMPARVAIALQDDGWWVRSDIIWHKPNPLPESITDRPTKSHEYVYLLAKSEEYFYDHEAVKEPAAGANLHTPNGWDTDEGRHGTIHRAPRREMRPVGRTVKAEPDARNSADGRSKPHSAARRGHASGAIVPYADNRQSRHGVEIPADGPTRSRRTVWTIATQSYRDAHFATYPEKLVEPCILAGTSARGACGLCGAPWERITQKGDVDLEWQRACGGDAEGEYHGKTVKPLPGWHNGQGGNLALSGITPAAVQDPSAVKARILEGMRPTITLGWRPTCACHPAFAGDPVPCRVLDPFNGSGTTGVVALREGRDYIGVELQPEYLGLARKRLMAETNDPPYLAAAPPPCPTPPSPWLTPHRTHAADPQPGARITFLGQDGALLAATVTARRGDRFCCEVRLGRLTVPYEFNDDWPAGLTVVGAAVTAGGVA